MRFAVLGAGAIGAFVGARLARGGSDVVLIARGAQLEALRRDGVRIVGGERDESVAVEASGELDAIAGADVVIVALKAHAIAPLAPRLGELLAPGAATVWAQNGVPWWYFQQHGGPLDGLTLESVDPGGVIAAHIPAGSVVGAVVYTAAELAAPGVVRLVEGRRLTLGEPDGSRSERIAAIAQAIQRGGMRAPIATDLRAEIWLKLIGNAVLNPISALTGATLEQLGERDEMRALILEAFGEIAQVGAALGIELPVSLERRLEAAVAVGGHKTSMLQDHEAGKPLEHACMTGAVIEIAQRLEIPVPRVETLAACIAQLDARTHDAAPHAAPR
jgi:2-dehydropantoate 2-reductase